MNIFFDNVNFNSRSGPNSFASRVAPVLKQKGCVIVPDPAEADIHLAFIEQINQKSPKSKLFTRLDGIWFKPEEFLSHNSGIKRTYDLADHVIWQSEFDKGMICHHWGPKKGSIIRNGIDLARVEVTNPDILGLRQKYEKVFVCAANWHRQKRLQENIELFSLLKQTYPSSCLLVMGGSPDYTKPTPGVFYTGNLPWDIMMQIYSAADWMIHLAWLDHCPNTVVEAISQNCPVICTDSGGTQEIVKGNGVVLPETTPYRFELTDYDNPYKLELSGFELPEIRVENDFLEIDLIADLYIDAFGRK